ncbi:Type IV leader peptidase family protein [Roseovarius gaetbuli]|uniref:Type IV leader peptidase family protein n=1 Tax=Roseovarius gaetbuli TaxID=1356575 RepID=A0A1X6ZD86_9RHOB|nr:prepilin peptidase [Roseovarius gaetbuli]SLN48092.1 Type IV leader peptidase family protein [Roseovarius gaetbuli]
MSLEISAQSALWFLPLVLPVCIWVAWSDLRRMKIPNTAVLTLTGIFVVVGLIALPMPDYAWRFAHLAVMLAVGIAANAIGAIGAGDAKFVAAAAPFVPLGDAGNIAIIFSVTLVVAYVTHRLAKASPLRRLAPEWASWTSGNKFPMGYALGGALAIYLGLGVLCGA